MNQGFWDNFLWPLAVAAVIGIAIYFRKEISKTLQKKHLITILNIETDQFYNIRLSGDENLFSKLLLVKKLIRDGKNDRFQVCCKKTFSVRGLNAYDREQIELHIRSKEQEIKDKVEILFKHSFDNRIEIDPNVAYTAIESILKKKDPNVTNFVKIELFQEQEPRIAFPIYLPLNQFSDLAQRQGKTIDEMKRSLQYEFNNFSLFNDAELYEDIIPAFVREIYRRKTTFNFDINNRNWAGLSLYEIGLG